MLKKIGIMIMLMGLFVTLGFGCKGMTAEQQAATKSVTLEWWTVYDDVDAIHAQIAEYTKLRPYIKVNVRQFRADELYQRLIEALADDRGPDILSVGNRDLRKFLNKLAPMPASVPDTLVETVKTQFGSDTKVTTNAVALPTVDDIDREFVPTVKKDAVVGNNIYGLPLSVDTMAIYYNKDLLDSAGIPEPPKTWEEFQASVKKITRFNKELNKITQAGAALGTGNNVPGADDILYLLFSQSNLPFVTESGQAVFNAGAKNAQSVFTVMNFYTDFANPTRDTFSWSEDMPNALDQFVSGSVGFFFGYSYHLPIIRARAPQMNLGTLPMLQLGSDTVTYKNSANYAIQTVTAKSLHPSEAWGLINYMARGAGSGPYLELTRRPTALRAYIARQREERDLMPFVDQILVARNWYRGRNYDAALRALRDMLHDWNNPPSNLGPDQTEKWRQDLLNRTVSVINQTM